MRAMTNKRIRLPREGLVWPEDRLRAQDFIDGTTDVEGHGLPITAPPSFGRLTRGHGGEAIPTPEDREDGAKGGFLKG